MWFQLLLPEEKWYLLLVVVINQSQVWVKLCLVFLSFRHNPWSLFFNPLKWGYFQVSGTKKEIWRYLSGRCSIFQCWPRPLCGCWFCREPLRASRAHTWALTWGQGSSWGGFSWCKGLCHSPFIPPTNRVFRQMFGTNTFFKVLLKRRRRISEKGLKPPQAGAAAGAYRSLSQAGG